MHPAYDAMCQVAEELGWPERFHNDLYKWDRQLVERLEPSEPFFWGIYPSGTHIFTADWRDGVGHTAADMLPTLEFCFPTCRYYWWDGVALQHLRGGAKRAAELLREHQPKGAR